jgi:hypothetical protein
LESLTGHFKLRPFYEEKKGRGIGLRVSEISDPNKWVLISAAKEAREALNLPAWLAPTKKNKFWDSSDCYIHLKGIMAEKLGSEYHPLTD